MDGTRRELRSHRAKCALAIIAFVLACGGAQRPVDLSEGGSDARSILALVNAPEQTAVTLVEEADVEEDPASFILAHRNGPDGQSNTADDDRFDSMAELLDVDGVDESTLQKLLRRARQLGL